MERFYTFFGSSLKKDLDLLRFLYLQKRFVPIEEISATLALDRRSIQKSFIALTKQLEQNAEEKHPILLAKHGAGYKFNGNKTDYKHLLRQLLAKNPFFQLLETLLLHNEINVVQFANDYFFSESTVRKRVYELENLLAPLGFTLKKSKRAFVILWSPSFGVLFQVLIGLSIVSLKANVRKSLELSIATITYLLTRLN